MKTNLIARNALLVLSLASAPMAFADMVCQGTTTSGRPVQIRVSDRDRSVSVELPAIQGLPARQFKRPATNVWDGHKSGLVTAQGFWLKYENHFGCYRFAAAGFIGNDLSRQAYNYDTASFEACGGGPLGNEFCR